MADYITKIITSQGTKQIDYNALANKPSVVNETADGLMLATDKVKLDAYAPTKIIVCSSNETFPEVEDGALLIVYEDDSVVN